MCLLADDKGQKLGTTTLKIMTGFPSKVLLLWSSDLCHMGVLTEDLSFPNFSPVSGNDKNEMKEVLTCEEKYFED